MAPSHSTPAPAPPRSISLHHEKDDLSELKRNGWWSAVITTLSFCFGQMTLARQLPPDPRQDSWLVMYSPYPPLLVSLVYIAAVTWWGPALMRTRKPVSGLRSVMMAYNAFQVVFSAWLFYEAGMGGWFTNYSYVCQMCDYSNNPQAIRMMHCAYWYHFSKYVDFIDTIFFVLHKKYVHISLLHMTHHGLMPISTWYGVRYHPGGHNTFFGFLNCFVHVVMYSYYLLAAMGPRVRPFLWWKKYLTALQMVQFTIVFFHSFQLAFVECEVPPILMTWVGFVSIVFFVLFADFYIKAYRKRDKCKKTESNGSESSPVYVQSSDNSDLATNVSKRTVKGVSGDSFIKGYTNGVSNGVSNGNRSCRSNGIPSTSAAGHVSSSMLKDLSSRLEGDMDLRSRV
ncbi:very long chain fatty acid elongase 7 [Procambarus clarkii]|uniref:very long chain fatty acid elongase 7 n=1 Tax=Procambarus clarkii TaxID=6728 RepID=UPI001E676221|nr:elongation of very long chain fatty acids protein-like [Procambarus clarkii]